MNTLLNIIKKFDHTSILVVGDVMLDIYVYGSVDRISPEAPIPVLRIEEKKEMPGGAGNVIVNLSSLGARTNLISIVGDDENGRKLSQLLRGTENAEFQFITVRNTPTVTKTRYISCHQQILRTDDEKELVISADIENSICEKVSSIIDKFDLIILSDYRKGVLTERVCQAIINIATVKNIPVFVDPKGSDYSIYKNSTLIKPNQKELKEAFPGELIKGKETEYARRLLTIYNITYCLLTLGKDGMLLLTKDKQIHFPSNKKELYDVSGAGDTVIATLAASYSTGAQIEDACRLSNIAGGIVVGKPGTSSLNPFEIENEIITTNKSYRINDLLYKITIWKKNGALIGFTNGCFDLIHPGHIQTLIFAKKHCDKLIVGLNSDRSVKILKGPDRPVHNERDRCSVLAEFESVDAIILFDDETPLELLNAIRPDVLIKGADYRQEEIVGYSLVESYGGQIILAPFIEDQSTTNIISRIKGPEISRFPLNKSMADK